MQHEKRSFHNSNKNLLYTIMKRPVYQYYASLFLVHLERGLQALRLIF